MKLVTTGSPRRRDRAATCLPVRSGAPPTPAISTGDLARASVSRNLIDTGAQSVLIHRHGRFGQHLGARHSDHVARDFDVHRLRVAQAACQHAGNVGWRARRVVQLHLVAGDFLEDLKLAVQRLGLWCSSRPERDSPLPGPPDSTTSGDFSANAAATEINHVQRTGTVSDGGHAQTAVDAPRSICRKNHAGFVRHRVERQDFGFFDDAEVGQGKVAGMPKICRAPCLLSACSSCSVRFMGELLGKVRGLSWAGLGRGIQLVARNFACFG